MEALKLVLVFVVIVIFIKWRKPLPLAIFAATLFSAFIYGLGPLQTAKIIGKSLTSWSTLSILLVLYLIMFLQRMMELRGDMNNAQRALNGLFNSRRVNASVAPMFIGLLPSAAAVTMAAPIVQNAADGYLTRDEQTLVASWFRHIPESFAPTYASMIIAVEITGVPLPSVMAGMLPMVGVLIAIGYFYLLRRMPSDTGDTGNSEAAGQARRASKKSDALLLGKSIWAMLLVLLLVLLARMPVYYAVISVIVVNFFVKRFSLREILPLFRTSIESRLLLTCATIMVFKDIIENTGVVHTLPELFATLPVPTFFVFFLIFFFGGIISGQRGIVAIGMPLAFSAMPDGGVPLMVLLMGASFIAMQVSPTHICLAIVTEYFHTNMGTMIRLTIPLIIMYCIALLAYYLLLIHLGF